MSIEDNIKTNMEDYVIEEILVCPSCKEGEDITIWMDMQIGADAKDGRLTHEQDSSFDCYSCQCGFRTNHASDFEKPMTLADKCDAWEETMATLHMGHPEHVKTLMQEWGSTKIFVAELIHQVRTNERLQ